MRVLAVTPLYPPYSLVGAWISTHECLVRLAQRGHEVRVVTRLSARAPYIVDGIPVHPRQELRAHVAGADVIISHAGDDGGGAQLARQRRVPSVRMVHAPAARLHSGELAVCNSRHQADALGHDPTVVVAPPVWPDRYRTEPGTMVTLVNLSEPKGGRLFWQLARRMPDVEFLGVAGGYGRQVKGSCSNVVVQPPTVDMAGAVYSRTRVLLMPSRAETYGRVAVEAACAGIPTVAHPCAGLVETLGDAGIFVDRADVAGWVRALRRLEDPEEWALASGLAAERARLLTPGADLDRFADAVEAFVAERSVAA